jgi:hypothetical protein
MNDVDFVTLVRSAVVIESNESEKLRRTSIKSGYIFCTRIAQMRAGFF